MYTSKTKYTKWTITKEKTGDNKYKIEYAGEKFDKNKHQIIIARYEEDIQWTESYNDIVLVYNKEDYQIRKHFNIKVDNIIKLPNIGREGETYLHHIIENYNNLAERITFLQGNPFEHNKTVLFGIDNDNKLLDIQSLGHYYLENQNIPPLNVIQDGQTITDFGLKYLIQKIDLNLISRFPHEFENVSILHLIDHYKNFYNTSEDVISHFLSNIGIQKEIIKGMLLDFTYSALFSIKREIIIANDKDFYIKLRNRLLEKIDYNGYILERCWLLIFQ